MGDLFKKGLILANHNILGKGSFVRAQASAGKVGGAFRRLQKVINCPCEGVCVIHRNQKARLAMANEIAGTIRIRCNDRRVMSPSLDHDIPERFVPRRADQQVGGGEQRGCIGPPAKKPHAPVDAGCLRSFPKLAFARTVTCDPEKGIRNIGHCLYHHVVGFVFVEATEGEQKPAQKKRVLSGVQPTGSLHLGNYLGAIRQWVKNQDEYDSLFCVVDLHAITAPHTPKELTKSTYQTAALYLAAGLDPAKSKIFVQSHVRQHAELAWLLNCATPMGWLERMIQFKEKAAKQEGEGASVGLFDYPVLMAADILLYQAALVPVGEDQRQHLELTRDIARRFNDKYGKKRRVFREPEALIVKSNARVMSLQDGTSKMSKSAENDNSRINLLDPPDVIRRKVKKCKTDAVMGVGYAPDRPEANNLLDMYGAVSGKSKEEVAAEAAERGGGRAARCRRWRGRTASPRSRAPDRLRRSLTSPATNGHSAQLERRCPDGCV